MTMSALRTDHRDRQAAFDAAVDDTWNWQCMRTQLGRIMMELRFAVDGSPIERKPRAEKLTDWSARLVAAAEIIALLDAGKIGTDEARAGLYGVTGEVDPYSAETLARRKAERAEAASAYVKSASANRAPRVVGV